MKAISIKEQILYTLSGTTRMDISGVTETVIRIAGLDYSEVSRNQARRDIHRALIELQRDGEIASCGKRIWIPNKRSVNEQKS